MASETRLTFGYFQEDWDEDEFATADSFGSSVVISVPEEDTNIKDFHTEEIVYSGATGDDFWDSSSKMWTVIAEYVEKKVNCGHSINPELLQKLWAQYQDEDSDDRIIEIDSDEGEFRVTDDIKGKWIVSFLGVELPEDDDGEEEYFENRVFAVES